MTNVSAVEKMAELMQQMEENSPRVAALQYCLKQVAGKVEEAEKRNAELEARCAALAAENALLKKSEPAPFSKLMMDALDIYQAGADEVPELAMLSAYKKLRDGLKTPATDAFLAELRELAHKEGAYFVANRMLAAWDAGFIDDTAKNAADIARMILTSTEFMADAPEGDFDRSFADGVLEVIAAQLRKGVQS
ncbi:Eae-like protein [Enterobacter hormaechei subsp. hoffmannii]|uniref:Eae-like protein n=1 Tax=Enterobacter hormaechei TaxID=158836 RepID=UPI002810D317|nr:Eae-like protein [Enterobacter hormaechei]MCU2912374.1 Eae-like protein [Enterobacter hormaechei subsp. hoffmannii]MCU2961549.1 Eae-like protein [Enterobacter hormaechei subsp. hoffmannii]WMQ85298.1 Eae-like protein [Enterobacter hormaechei]WMQ87831.1 Eae-like protein [Enterobacter hormaechei]